MRIGIDMEKIDRLNDKLIKTISTEKELEWLNSFSEKTKPTHYGSIWATKEATIKALGSGNMKEIELLHNQIGKPQIKLYGATFNTFQSFGLKEIEVSISHTKTDVISLVVMQ